MPLLSFCEWLADTRWSIALHESTWAYSIVESVHVLALCLFLGMAVMLDLRLLSVTMRRAAVSEVMGQLLPWTAAGFVVMVISGALLVYAIPVRTYQSIFFRVKVVMLILAGLNAWVFHSTVYRKVAEWDLVGFGILPRPSERLCTQKTWLEYSILTGSGVHYRSVVKSKRKFQFIHILNFIGAVIDFEGPSGLCTEPRFGGIIHGEIQETIG